MERRDSKTLGVFDEGCGGPSCATQDYPAVSDAAGLLGQAACRAYLSSMSEYASDPQAYNLYGKSFIPVLQTIMTHGDGSGASSVDVIASDCAAARTRPWPQESIKPDNEGANSRWG